MVNLSTLKLNCEIILPENGSKMHLSLIGILYPIILQIFIVKDRLIF